MELDRHFVDKLESIPWFCKCGGPSPFEWAASATSTKAVLSAITSRKWENMVLETQGDVTEQLSLRSIKGLGCEYQEWNNLVQNFKNDYMPQLNAQWGIALQQYGLNTSEVLSDVSFNVLSITVIDAYKTLVPMPRFFCRLLEVYELGYLPCGWRGPKGNGKLIIF